MYIVTAVVGVETWYKPLIWNILYRDLFIVMILGEMSLSLHRDSLACCVSELGKISSLRLSGLPYRLFVCCDVTHEPLQRP